MPCPFCELFACYQRQIARRLDTGTLAMSAANARLLVGMADQIRTLTRATLHRLENEAVPTLLCDLLGGFAEGLLAELGAKLLAPAAQPSHPAPLAADALLANGKRNACQAG